MEPESDFYKPFLSSLAERPGCEIVPKSGLVWKELNDTLNSLHRQIETKREQGIQPQRNDTLLVTANLSFFPRKKFQNFASIATLVLYQFLTSIRYQSLFQKYGLVRMLIWTNDEDKRTLLPRSVVLRKRAAVEAELVCEWMHEVAGRDGAQTALKSSVRDRWLDIESAINTLERMKRSSIQIPTGRETEIINGLPDLAIEIGEQLAGTRVPWMPRPYFLELEELEKASAMNPITKTSSKYVRMRNLRYLLEADKANGAEYLRILSEQDNIMRLRQERAGGSTMDLEEAWNEKIRAMTKNSRIDFLLLRDNLHLFRQKPPVMLWDRREVEPLVVKPTEFFPNVESCLLDIQPKATHPLLREVGPNSNRAGDMFDMILRGVFAASVEPISRQLESIWPGASAGIAPYCPSLCDPTMGGTPVSRYGELCGRTLNEGQWMEILEGFMKWPFRPAYPEMVGRLAEDSEADSVEDNAPNSAEFT
jgi:mitochondrial transcription factor 1